MPKYQPRWCGLIAGGRVKYFVECIKLYDMQLLDRYYSYNNIIYLRVSQNGSKQDNTEKTRLSKVKSNRSV